MEKSENSILKIRAARYSIITAVSLALMKFVVGLMTGSLAVIASAVDSLLDIVMSGVNFIAIRQAEQPADGGHSFGHGKYETLATLIQSIVISASGGWIMYEAIRRLNAGDFKVQQVGNGVIVLAISVAASFWISRYLRRVGKATDSSALQADALHFAMDIYTNGALLAGLVILSFVDAPWLDPVMSLFVALYILKEALSLARHALRDMLDAELPDEVRNEVIRLVNEHHGELLDIHNLRTRRAGSQKIMDFHLTVCKHLTVQAAHDLADHLEETITKEIRGANVTIHVEPCRRPDCPGTDKCTAVKNRIE
ncbi:MAG: cation diffusion facilitator family transporter [Desulfuromonadales bacterium]|nr:cation diffusion facilitator family transporter [Desulfuromonadales bacterium]